METKSHEFIESEKNVFRAAVHEEDHKVKIHSEIKEVNLHTDSEDLEKLVVCLDKWSLNQRKKYVTLREKVIILSEKLKCHERETEIKRKIYESILEYVQKQLEITEETFRYEKEEIVSLIYEYNEELQAPCLPAASKVRASMIETGFAGDSNSEPINDFGMSFSETNL